MSIIITDDEHRQQVKDFINYRHRLERKPNTERMAGSAKYSKRVDIDAKLADLKEAKLHDMSDDAFIAEMQNFGG